MMIDQPSNKLNIVLYFSVFFLTFLGYYAILLGIFNIGLAEVTRIITVPLRLLIMGMLVLVFLSNKVLLKNTAALWFLLFTVLYSIRLLIELQTNTNYYMPISGVMLYFFSFAVIPFLGISLNRVNPSRMKAVFNSFLVGGALFSVLALLSYGQ